MTTTIRDRYPGLARVVPLITMTVALLVAGAFVLWAASVVGFFIALWTIGGEQ